MYKLEICVELVKDLFGTITNSLKNIKNKNRYQIKKNKSVYKNGKNIILKLCQYN